VPNACSAPVLRRSGARSRRIRPGRRRPSSGAGGRRGMAIVTGAAPGGSRHRWIIRLRRVRGDHQRRSRRGGSGWVRTDLRDRIWRHHDPQGPVHLAAASCTRPAFACLECRRYLRISCRCDLLRWDGVGWRRCGSQDRRRIGHRCRWVGHGCQSICRRDRGACSARQVESGTQAGWARRQYGRYERQPLGLVRQLEPDPSVARFHANERGDCYTDI
jgi:hypothetical protein